MRNCENSNVMSTEKRALICWYYQCKKFTAIRISNITHEDIEDVKSVLRDNCPEFVSAERQEIAYQKYIANMSRVYKPIRC